MIIYRNKESDFVYHISFADKDGNAIELPEHVDILMTAERGCHSDFRASFVSSGECCNCKKSGDGIDIFICLSRRPIGCGRMIIDIIAYYQDSDFEGGERRVRSRAVTPIILWDGASDGDLLIVDNMVVR